jgi:hypothetical protein
MDRNALKKRAEAEEARWIQQKPRRIGVAENHRCLFLRGDAAGFGPLSTFLIDKIEKVRGCSCIAERAMMVF